MLLRRDIITDVYPLLGVIFGKSMIDLIQQIFKFALALCFVLGCLMMLYYIFRFAVLSEWRTRGWQQRLRHPELAAVTANWKVELPSILESFYQDADFVELNEFYLARSTSQPSEKWFIFNIVPFTIIDLTEWVKITNVPGLPIAVGGDDDKSIYYLPFENLRSGSPVPVMLRPAGGLPALEVASTIEEFMQFHLIEDPYADEE